MSAIISAKAMMMCSFGVTPSTLQPTNCVGVMAQGDLANAMDCTPANIPPFGMCNSLLNPAVVSATIAAFGVLTPQPCTLVPTGMWVVNKPTIQIKSASALSMDAKLMCAYGGIIQFIMSPSMKVML